MSEPAQDEVRHTTVSLKNFGNPRGMPRYLILHCDAPERVLCNIEENQMEHGKQHGNWDDTAVYKVQGWVGQNPSWIVGLKMRHLIQQ